MSNQLQVIRQAMPEIQKKFQSVPNCNLDFAREAGFAMQAMETNTYLATMSLESIKKCIVNVAMTGLTLNPVLKLAYLVPRKGNLILDISYMGLINVLVTSGAALKIEAEVVKENDQFDYEKGTNPYIKHKPALVNRGQVIAAYAIAYLPNGEKQFEVMEREELEKVKKVSEAAKSGKGSPYEGWESEMYRKAPVKRLFKFLPKHNIPDHTLKALEIEEETHGANFTSHTPAASIASLLDDEPETSAVEITSEN
jgi:recombination protein RecT